MKLIVQIPCLNEEPTISDLVQRVRHHLKTVIVVDDGSTDRTAKAATDAGAVVLRHTSNKGKGAALHEGWQFAQKHGFKWALTLDGDGQHSSEDIPSFFQCVNATSAALVVGNRMANATGMPWLRRLVNQWMSRRLSRAAGQELPDSQCGFRLMNLEAWSHIPITTSRFEIESEVLLNFARAGNVIRFVPIRVIYKNEKSKIHPLQDTVRWFRWWKRARAGKGKS
jgi:glycosyltransferase involved in cell wall biosynthesis